MSLEISLQNAISGLQTSQQSLQVISNNIANANVDGYTRKTIQQTSRVINGQGFGVDLALVSRNVDAGILKQLRTETAELERLATRQQFLSQVNAFFGRPEDNNSLSHLSSDLASNFGALAVTPETVATQFGSVKAAMDVVNELQRLSNEVQRLRSEANSQISGLVRDFNTAMNTVVDTNSSIIEFTASNISIAELEDQRDAALNTMSEIMDIQFFQSSDGSISVFTGSGKTLIDGTKRDLIYAQPAAMAPTLEYVPPGAVNYVSPAEPTGHPARGIPGVFIGTQATENDITNEISAGKMKALIALRDDDLPAIQDQLDEYASQLKSELNTIHNKGAGFPPAIGLNGDRFVAGGMDISASTGLVRIAVVDDAGNIVESNVLDLSNAAYTDVNSLLTNGSTLGINDLFTNLNAAIGTDNHLSLTASGGGNHVVINELTSSLSAAGDVNKGFSDFFGLNNLYSSNENFSRYRTDFTASSSSAAVTTGGTLSFIGSFGSSTVTINANDSISTIAAAINANGTLSTAGITAQVISAGSGFRLEVSDTGGEEFAMTGGGSLFADTNLETDNRGISNRLDVRADIQDDTFLISRGALQSNTFNSNNFASDTAVLNGAGGAQTLTFTGPGLTQTVNYNETTDTLASLAVAINSNVTLLGANVTAEVIAVGANFQLKITDSDGNNFHITDSGSATLGMATTQGVTPGDGTVAAELAAKFEAAVTFKAAPGAGGGLAQVNATFSDYSATILSSNSAILSATTTDLQFQESLAIELFNKNASISGVNIDEELANMIIFEQAYLAAARIIDVTQSLFRALDEIVGG